MILQIFKVHVASKKTTPSEVGKALSFWRWTLRAVSTWGLSLLETRIQVRVQYKGSGHVGTVWRCRENRRALRNGLKGEVRFDGWGV